MLTRHFLFKSPLSLLLLIFIELSSAAEYVDYGSSTKYCYSCMSEDFLLHWPYLEEVYFRPMNFTDHCFSIPAKINIGMVPCSHSMCVTVIEPRILAGQHIGNNIIRGCFANIFKFGVTQRPAPAVLDTSCSRMPSSKLLPPHLSARSSNRTIELCWCMGQLCNDYPSVPINHASSRSQYLLLAVFFILLSIQR